MAYSLVPAPELPPVKRHRGNQMGAKLKPRAKEKTFVCGVCNRGFGYKHVLQNHERIHRGEKPFPCPECHKTFRREHQLTTHLRVHTGENPYKCTYCTHEFKQLGNLQRHLRVHTGEKPYVCEWCEAKFAGSSSYKAHINLHTGDKPFKCKYCSQQFRLHKSMQRHKMQIHADLFAPSEEYVILADDEHDNKVSEDIECSSPSIETKPIISTLLPHLPGEKKDNDLDDEKKQSQKNQSGEDKKRLDCSQCDRSFTIRQNLRIHLRTHTKERPHQCNMCPRRFVTEACLKNHQRIHTGEKPYLCDVCGAMFAFPYAFRSHYSVHKN